VGVAAAGACGGAVVAAEGFGVWFVCCAVTAMAKTKLEQIVSRIVNIRLIGCH